MKTLKFVTVSALMLTSFGLTAQDEPAKEKSRKEQREAMKVAYITKELKLTTEESKEFWPIYNEMEAELKTLKKEHKIDRKKKLEDLSDEEVEKLIQKSFEMKEKEISIRKSYHSKFKSVLPVKKVAKLYHIEKGMGKHTKPNHPPKERGSMMKPGHKPAQPNK